MIDEKMFIVACKECDKLFDLLNDDDVNEYTYGHDCETE